MTEVKITDADIGKVEEAKPRLLLSLMHKTSHADGR